MRIYETNGKFIVATECNGQYHAPMTKQSARITGCFAVFSNDIDDLAKSPNVRKFTSLSAARRSLKNR